MSSVPSKARPLKIGEPLIRLDSVDSTNNFAMNLLKNREAMEGTVILAGYQTTGRGQAGNTWQSMKDQNLLFSLILTPEFLKAEKQFYLSMSISNAVCRLLELHTKNVNIKWPNDILVNHKKIAGILIENIIMGDTIAASVAGIGLNVNQRNFPDDLNDVISLGMVNDKEYNVNELFDRAMESLNEDLEPLYNRRLHDIRTSYLNRLYRLNEWARYRDETGTFEGRINDVADSGELIVEKKDGSRRLYMFKEIASSP